MNHLYMVTDGDKKFVFRVYTFNWRTKVAVAEELRLLRHLKASNIPVSYPIPDTQGEWLQEINAPEGLRYGALFSFADGKKIPKFTPEASYHIGVAMAKMHRATENFALNRFTYNPQTLLIDSLKRTKSFFTTPSDEVLFLEQATAYLVKKYEQASHSDLRTGVIHLDIWFDNMHINTENDITLFDFDFCGTGWQCHDIGYFLYQLFSTNQGANEYEPKAESFINGYQSITSISDEEKQLIPLVSIGTLLFYINIQCDRYDTWSNIFLNEDHLKRYVTSVKRWAAYNKVVFE